jgi:thiol-disulfide isomerase/thioredoxin
MVSSIRNLLIRLTFLCALVQVSLANLYEGDKNVKIFDKFSAFEKEVIKGDGVWMVQFYSPTCPHCQKLVNDYKKAAEITAGVYNIAAVDMSTEAGQRIGATYKVDTYPTIFMFGDDKAPSPYTGSRNTQDMLQKIVEFAMKTLRVRAGDPTAKNSAGPSKVVQLTSANFQAEVLDSPLVSMVACKFLYTALVFVDSTLFSP